MSWIAYLKPGNTPAFILEKKDELLILRDRLLQFILNTGTLLAVVAYLYFWINPLTRERILTIYFFSGVIVFVILLTVLRRINYFLRANLTLLIFYGAAVFGMTQQGVSGSGALFLTAFIVLSSLLIGLGGGIRAVVLSLATMIGMGYGIQQGWLPLPPQEPVFLSGSFAAWGLKSAFLLAITSVLVASVYTLVTGLLRSTGEQRKLAQDLQKEQSLLSNRVKERTENLERRLVQIRTAVEINHAIGELRNPEALLQQIIDLIRERFGLYYVGIFLMDERGEYAVLRAGTGEAGQAMVANRHRLQVGSASMIGWATAQKQPRIALDTGQEAVRFDNPYLPRTRSELAIPILSHNQVLGALTIQSEQANAFDQDDILVFHGIADNLGVALENSRLLDEAQQNLEEIQALNRSYLMESWQEASKAGGQFKFTFENPETVILPGKEKQVQVPLTVRDQKIGEMTLETNLSALTSEEMEFIEAIASQTAIALENARLLQETQQRAMTEERLNELTAQFTQSVSIEEILKTAVQELGQMPAVSEVSVQLTPSDFSKKPGSNGSHPEAVR